MKSEMSFSCLPIRNLKRKPGRTWALILLTAFLSFSLLAGSLVVLSLRNGLNSLSSRLGADIIVVPKAAKTKVNLEEMLLQGTTGAFYMDAGILEKVQEVSGVEKAAPQVFLATLKADCCSAKIQVIGIDQSADFTIQPWIDESTGKKMALMDVIVGCDIAAGTGESIRLYNQNCPVIARLLPTGTGLDTAVYCSVETMDRLLEAAEALGVSHKVNSGSTGNVVSAVYVKVRDGVSVESVANQLNSHPLWKVDAVQMKSMITGVSDGLSGISSTVTALVAVVWALAFVILLISFTMVMNERKREFAVLRLIGASRKMLGRTVLTEAVLVSLLGGLLGVGLGLITVFPFSHLIESALNLPFLTPSFTTAWLMAVGILLGTMVFGAAASARTAYRLSRVDTGEVLREGN